VYVAFSGGKDSTVLLDLVRRIYPDVPGVFVDTGLEYPEIRVFVKTKENIVWLRPKMPFPEVIKKYGYPVVSKEVAQKIYEIRNTNSDKLRNKRLYGDEKGNGKIPDKWKSLINAPFLISNKCCNVMKKAPFKRFVKQTKRMGIIGTMAGESRLRLQGYLQNGCNLSDAKTPLSKPLSFWSEDDIWDYIKKYNLPYSKIYDTGVKRTGCMFCMFGVHLEKGENRFQRMKKTHPNQWNYCINNLGCGKVLDYIGVEYDDSQQKELGI